MSNSIFVATAANAIDYSDDDDEESSASEEVSFFFISVKPLTVTCAGLSLSLVLIVVLTKSNIQNRTSRSVRTAAMEDHRLRGLFGARIEIVLKVWLMLGEGGLRPKKSKPKHLLWMLYYLKVYPREAPGCSAVGRSKGAIDP